MPSPPLPHLSLPNVGSGAFWSQLQTRGQNRVRFSGTLGDPGVVPGIAVTAERREVPAVLASRASPAMGLEVQEVGPTETPRQTGTVYLPATTVPPTVVALRP